MPQGKGSQLHNRRDYAKFGRPIPDNIDNSKTSENITLVDKDIRQAYKEIFGETVEHYNSKQKRADRKIKDYYEHIQKSKNGEKLFYEDVIQWGSKDDFKDLQTKEKAKNALVEYASTFESRNPNLKLIGAYIHLDEASPHLHLDYVPVATGYSRGLEKRNSLDKAMKQMGFQPESESRKNNATKLWKENERAVFGEICRSLGLEVEQERKSERKNLTVDEYKEARDKMMSDVDQELKTIEEKRDYINNEAEAMRIEYIAKRNYVERCRKIAKQMYPEYVKINKHIFGEDTVTLPKEKWEQRFLAQNENIITQNAIEQFESTLERFKELNSYNHSKKIKASLNALQLDYDSLHTQLEILEGKNNKLIRVIKVFEADEDKFYEALNRGLDSLELTDYQRDRFLDEFYRVRDGKQEQNQQKDFDYYEEVSDEWDMEL